jgi:hypothetical protein
LPVRTALAVALCAAALVSGDAASAAKVGDLEAWAAAGGKPLVGMSTAGFRGPLVTRLSPGTYRVHVRAGGDMPFHLFGPGVDRRTKVNARYATVYETWTIRLRHGVYRYRLEGGWAEALSANGIPTRRSFAVR